MFPGFLSLRSCPCPKVHVNSIISLASLTSQDIAVTSDQTTSCTYSPKFISIANFVDDNITPLAEMSGSLMQDLKDLMHHSNSSQASMLASASIPLMSTALSMRTRGTLLFSNDESGELSLDDNLVMANSKDISRRSCSLNVWTAYQRTYGCSCVSLVLLRYAQVPSGQTSTMLCS